MITQINKQLCGYTLSIMLLQQKSTDCSFVNTVMKYYKLYKNILK